VDRVNARRWLLAYAAAVVAVTLVHDPRWLGAALAVALAAGGRARWHLIRRTLFSVFAFNLVVSVGYLIVTWRRGGFVPDYLLLVNLRVVLLVYLSFWFAARVDVLAALRGWPTLTLVATLALGQMRTFGRIVRDFRFAFVSRNLRRPHFRDRARHAAAQSTTLLDKSLAAAAETTLAMRSRGAFDD
jgi:cobalt/nickel transport system permease protein